MYEKHLSLSKYEKDECRKIIEFIYAMICYGYFIVYLILIPFLLIEFVIRFIIFGLPSLLIYILVCYFKVIDYLYSDK